MSKISMRGMWLHFGRHGSARGLVFLATELNSVNIVRISTCLGFVSF